MDSDEIAGAATADAKDYVTRILSQASQQERVHEIYRLLDIPNTNYALYIATGAIDFIINHLATTNA